MFTLALFLLHELQSQKGSAKEVVTTRGSRWNSTLPSHPCEQNSSPSCCKTPRAAKCSLCLGPTFFAESLAASVKGRPLSWSRPGLCSHTWSWGVGCPAVNTRTGNGGEESSHDKKRTLFPEGSKMFLRPNQQTPATLRYNQLFSVCFEIYVYEKQLLNPSILENISIKIYLTHPSVEDFGFLVIFFSISQPLQLV